MKRDKKNKELAIKRGKRLKSALEHSGLKAVDITRDGFITESQVSDWINGKVCISEPTIRDIHDKFLKEIRIEYLLAYDDFMTDTEKTLNEYQEKHSFGKVVNPVIELLEYSGYKLSGYGADDIYYEFTKKDKSIVLKTNDLIKFSELICEYADFMLNQCRYIGLSSLPPFFLPDTLQKEKDTDSL